MAKAAAASKKTASHPPYAELIKAGILSLKDRNGSSRQSLKKYIKTNYNITAPNFDALFNAALRKGVEKEDFIQPKGTSGPIKLNKKKPETKPVAKKVVPAKKAAPAKRGAPKEKTAPAKKATVKKAAAPKSAPKPKAVPKKSTATSKVTKKAPAKKAPTAAAKKAAPKKKPAPAKKAAPKKKAAAKK